MYLVWYYVQLYTAVKLHVAMKGGNKTESDIVQKLLWNEKVVYPVYSPDLTTCGFSFPKTEKDVTLVQTFVQNNACTCHFSVT